MPTTLRVMVIGGGIGGLCLAHGLRRAGVAVTVFERDASPAERRQGYRLRISPEGEQALRDCLPAAVYRLLADTGNRCYGSPIATYDERLTPLWTPRFQDPRGNAPDKLDALDRVTFRHALLTGLDQVIRYGQRFERYRENADGTVTAFFADGQSHTADLLVAADGVNSRVRAQAAPDLGPTDLGVRTVFSRIRRSSAVRGGVPARLRHRFSYVIGSDGYHLGLAPMQFRSRPEQHGLPPAEDYFMAVFDTHRDELALPDNTFLALTGGELCALVTRRTARWHPELRGLFTHADPEVTFGVALRATTPVRAWPAGPVVPVGDAGHAMPPSGGVGANTAVRDASVLATALAAVSRHERSLADALAAYQREMVEYATEAVTMSLRIAQWAIKKLDVPVPEETPT